MKLLRQSFFVISIILTSLSVPLVAAPQQSKKPAAPTVEPPPVATQNRSPLERDVAAFVSKLSQVNAELAKIIADKDIEKELEKKRKDLEAAAKKAEAAAKKSGGGKRYTAVGSSGGGRHGGFGRNYREDFDGGARGGWGGFGGGASHVPRHTGFGTEKLAQIDHSSDNKTTTPTSSSQSLAANNTSSASSSGLGGGFSLDKKESETKINKNAKTKASNVSKNIVSQLTAMNTALASAKRGPAELKKEYEKIVSTGNQLVSLKENAAERDKLFIELDESGQSDLRAQEKKAWLPFLPSLIQVACFSTATKGSDEMKANQEAAKAILLGLGPSKIIDQKTVNTELKKYYAEDLEKPLLTAIKAMPFTTPTTADATFIPAKKLFKLSTIYTDLDPVAKTYYGNLKTRKTFTDELP